MAQVTEASNLFVFKQDNPLILYFVISRLKIQVLLSYEGTPLNGRK
jgi:hypothetical protein